MIFAHRRGRDAEAQKARKIRCFGTPKTTNGRPTSIETTQKHVVFTTRDNEKRRVFWPQMAPNEAIWGLEWLQMARSWEKCKKHSNIGQSWRLKRAKIDVHRPTKAILSQLKTMFLVIRPRCRRELGKPSKIRAFGSPKSIFRDVSTPKAQ